MKANACNLPEGKANSSAGYALHYRRNETPCEGCKAAFARYRSKTSTKIQEQRRRAVNRALIHTFRTLHPEQADETERAAGREFDRTHDA